MNTMIESVKKSYGEEVVKSETKDPSKKAEVNGITTKVEALTKKLDEDMKAFQNETGSDIKKLAS